jgi:class 3 adenylate cyclase
MGGHGTAARPSLRSRRGSGDLRRPGRSTAIVLFTDLVGSTELRSRLGEDTADSIRRQHNRLVTQAIEGNRGRLVKNLGDGVMALFTGAGNGIEAAVRIQQAAERLNRSARSTIELEVRVGLSAGDVALEDGDCFGTPVVEAARLCAAARGGQILAAEVVCWLAHSAGAERFSPAGHLELKGIPYPVPAVEIEWAVERSIPLPHRLERTGALPFVGREAERALLTRAWKEAVGGERRAVLVAGEPGIGKTRLVSETARVVHEDGGVVLYGRCDEELGLPYQPFVEALRGYVAACSDDDLMTHLGSLSAEFTRLLPEWELGLADISRRAADLLTVE